MNTGAPQDADLPHGTRPSLLPSSTWPIIIGLAALYVSLFLSYRAYEIDNPWYLSFSHSTWVDHYHGDLFLNGIFPNGMGGTAVFGKLASLLQALVLGHFGWQQVPAMLFSTACVLLGLVLWSGFLRASGLSEAQCHACMLSLGLAEPFVGMAERFRYEPVSFLLMAAAFWLAACKRPALALIIGLLALETEPAAAVVFAAVWLFLYRSGEPIRKLIAASALAVLLFAGYYLLLHPDIVSVLRHTDWSRGSGQKALGGFLRAYFLERRRHLPELLLFLAAGAVFFLKRAQAPGFVTRMAEVTVLVCIFSFVMGWPTPAYMVFFFPPALVVVAWALESLAAPAWSVVAIFAVFMLPQYAALVYINHGQGFRGSDIERVAAAIARAEQMAGLDDAHTAIMGDYSVWYAHPERYRGLAAQNLGFLPDEDLFLCFDGPITVPSMIDGIVRYCPAVTQRLAVKEIETVTIRGHVLRILVPVRSRAR
jgi:hypothetical protein